MRYNNFQQPIGDALPDFTIGQRPDITMLDGQTVRVEKLTFDHEEDLFNEVYGPQSPAQNWTYLSIDAFENRASFHDYLATMVASSDPYYLAIVDKKTGKAVGTFALMRINTSNRVIEMGWVVYSQKLQRTRQATEAQYLVMRYVFEEMGYRRYEWKCDHLNAPSRNAALRLGFTFEGTFRQAVVYKGRTRDTDWLSLLDSEWTDRKKALENWLADSNFTADGQQKQSLTAIREQQ